MNRQFLPRLKSRVSLPILVKDKFYAVQKGRHPGVYQTWDECRRETDGFPGTVFKSFYTYEEAKSFAFPVKSEVKAKNYKYPVDAYTDGSFIYPSGGWGFILKKGNDVLVEAYGPCTKDKSIRNIGGEIQAAENAIHLAIQLGADYICIHHDYEGVGQWGTGSWSTNRKDTEAYANYVAQSRGTIAIEFCKVKGHSGDKYNNIADRLAGQGVTAQKDVYNFRNEHVDINCDFSNELDVQEPEQQSLENYIKSCELTNVTTNESTIPNKPKSNEPQCEDEDKKDDVLMSMSFSELLKNWRKEEGITQADAVELSGIKAYGNLERGKDVKLFPLDLQNLYSVVMPEEMSFGAFVELWANSTSERETS